MQTDVKASTITSSGVLVSGKRIRLKGFYVTGATVTGVLTFYDGSGTTAPVVLVFNTIGTPLPIPLYVAIPGEGILCEAGLYASMVNITTLTIFYG
jgi:hypothetical protein